MCEVCQLLFRVTVEIRQYINIHPHSTTFHTFHFQTLYKCLHISSKLSPARENWTQDVSVDVLCSKSL